MTDPDSGPKEVYVKHGYLKQLGGLFTQWGIDLGTAQFKTLTIKITPGSYGEAEGLRILFDLRKEEIGKEISKLQGMFTEIGRHLVVLDQKYQNVEDLNKDDIYRIYPLIDSVEKIYPGAKGAIPPQEDGVPYAPPKEPPKDPPK